MSTYNPPRRLAADQRPMCNTPGCDQRSWSLGKCRPHAMVPLGQEDPEDRRDDPGADD